MSTMRLPQLLSKVTHLSFINQQLRRLISSPSFSVDLCNQEDTQQAISRNKKSIFSNPGVLDVSDIARDSLIEVLVNSVVYKNDGILALSKPAGLPVSGRTIDGQLSLTDVLGDVTDSVHRPNAVLISAPEKESSGIVLLADDNITANKLTKDISDASRRSELKRQYIALTVGIPALHQGSPILYLGQEVVGEKLMTIIKHDFTNGSLKRQETKKSKVDYNVLDYNRKLNCALIEMWPLKGYKHQLQVHATSLLCCVLGDHLYSNRVQSVLHTSVLIDPLEAKSGTQNIPKMIRRTMNLSLTSIPRLPLHLHYHQLYLKRPNGDLHVIAPLPSYFKKSTRLLNLKTPT